MVGVGRGNGREAATATDDAAVDLHAAAPLERLFSERFVAMVRLGTLLTGSKETAEEVVMDAFARMAARPSLPDEPAAYLRTSVANGCHSHHRRLRTVRRQPVPPTAPHHDPELDELWSRLADLRPSERACVVLRFYEDLPLGEIAEVLDLPTGTVKSHLHRGLARLRDLLGEEAP